MMIETLKKVVEVNLGPLLFLSISALLCLALPEAKSTEAIYLVIGAALTRIKRTDN